MGNQSNTIILIFKSFPSMYKASSMRIPSLYPYHSIELSVIFVYGIDYKRQIHNNPFKFSSMASASFQCNFTLFLAAAIILCIIRRNLKLRRDGFISCTIDTMVVYFGGGRYRAIHRLERWFFGITSIGAFFVVAIWAEAILVPAFIMPRQSIGTFEELAEINPPIHIDPFLIGGENIIIDMMRWILINILASLFDDIYRC